MAGVRRAAAADCRCRERQTSGHAQTDGSTAGGELAHGFQLLRRGGEGGLDRGDFTEPALSPGLLKAIDEVGADLLERRPLNWFNAEERASDTGFSCCLMPIGRAGASARSCSPGRQMALPGLCLRQPR